MPAGPADHRKSLDTIANRTTDVLADASAELSTLTDRATGLIQTLRQDRAQARMVLDQFTVSRMMVEAGVARDDPGGGMPATFDLDAIHRDIDALESTLAGTQSALISLTLARDAVDDARDTIARTSEDEDPSSDPISTLRLRQATMAAREEERGRLAREMHDGPAQVFANAIFGIEIAEQVARRDPTRVADELSQLRRLLRDGVGEMRRFMSDLRPAMLTERGLIPTLQRHIADFNRFFGKHIVLVPGALPDTLTDDQQLAMFRIVQEALQNVQKHANTQSGRVELGQEGDAIILTIHDDGRGFDGRRSPDAPTGGGAGLPGMWERARLIGADLSVRTAPGAGVTIRLVLPAPQYQKPAPGPTRSEGSSR